MDRKVPIPGSFYRHFKGNIYQIKSIAFHSETGEQMVVYQSMYPPFGVWVRPLSLFLEPVDRKKYPAATQNYRFQEIVYQNQMPCFAGKREGTSASASTAGNVSSEKEAADGIVRDNSAQNQSITDAQLRDIIMSGQTQRRLEGRLPQEEIAERGFMILLDAQSFRERRHIFVELRPYWSDRLLHNIAVSLDIALEEGTLQQHYESVLHCLEAFEKYEGGRLR